MKQEIKEQYKGSIKPKGFFEEIKTHYFFNKLNKRKNTDQNE